MRATHARTRVVQCVAQCLLLRLVPTQDRLQTPQRQRPKKALTHPRTRQPRHPTGTYTTRDAPTRPVIATQTDTPMRSLGADPPAQGIRVVVQRELRCTATVCAEKQGGVGAAGSDEPCLAAAGWTETTGDAGSRSRAQGRRPPCGGRGRRCVCALRARQAPASRRWWQDKGPLQIPHTASACHVP